MPQGEGPRGLRDFLDVRTFKDRPHLPPARAHLRASLEKSRLEAPPGSSFPRKLSAFLRNQVFSWFFSYIKFRLGPRHRFQIYDGTGDRGIYPLAGDSYFVGDSPADEDIRISVAGDWATGTDESDRVAQRMLAFRPHYTVHLGDVYYVGDEDEADANYLGRAGSGRRAVMWPIGSVGAFALNGNHEMYANGQAYFQSILPAMGVRAKPDAQPGKQKASFFCLRNSHWDVVGVDTGYNSVGLPILELIPWFAPSCKLPDQLLDWLRTTVKLQESSRGLVMMGHHQYYSAFESGFPRPARQLAEFIRRPVLWFWGHEHRMAVYGKGSAGGIEAFGRCLGHGGMPVDIGVPPKAGQAPLVLYDEREYTRLDGTPVGFNGIANLTFRGDRLTVQYRGIDDQLLLTEEWRTHDGVLTGSRIERGLEDPKLIAVRDLNVAIGGAQSQAAG
jgi:hypothetical protein